MLPESHAHIIQLSRHVPTQKQCTLLTGYQQCVHLSTAHQGAVAVTIRDVQDAQEQLSSL